MGEIKSINYLKEIFTDSDEELGGLIISKRMESINPKVVTSIFLLNCYELDLIESGEEDAENSIWPFELQAWKLKSDIKREMKLSSLLDKPLTDKKKLRKK